MIGFRGRPYAFLNSIKHVSGDKEQVAYEQDHEATVDARNIDTSVVNNHGDDGYCNGDIKSHNV
jgi:hypothetical protein